MYGALRLAIDMKEYKEMWRVDSVFLSDTEDLQMLISNTATNLHNERWVESRCWFIVLLLASV